MTITLLQSSPSLSASLSGMGLLAQKLADSAPWHSPVIRHFAVALPRPPTLTPRGSLEVCRTQKKQLRTNGLEYKSPLGT